MVLAEFEQGASVAEVAAKWGCTSRTVRNVVHRGGLSFPERRKPVPEVALQRPRYPALYVPGWLAGQLAAGATLGAVAAEVGCSITAVRIAVEKLDITGRRGPSEVRLPQLHDRRWVRAQFVTRRRPVADIAEELGASESAVYRAVHRFGLSQLPRRRTPRPTEARLRTDWRLFARVTTIGRLHGVSTALAEVWLAELGIFVREAPAIPPAELQAALAAGDSIGMIARRHSLDQRVVRVEVHRIAHLDVETPGASG